MQYKGYTIQPFSYGYIVRNLSGFVVYKCATVEEAQEWVDYQENNT